jgi:hypothetical protein
VTNAASLVKVLGICLRTAKSCLRDLLSEGLIEKKDGRYQRTTELLDTVRAGIRGGAYLDVQRTLRKG